MYDGGYVESILQFMGFRAFDYIHISKDSDLIHDNYRLNQIAYDNSDNFHLIDRQFMKIEDIILGYNSSIIKTKYEYFSCGNNEFGQMGLIYDNDALLTEFKKNIYLKHAKKISIGKENIGYIDDNKCSIVYKFLPPNLTAVQSIVLPIKS